jgi:hypothetical protein
VLFSAEEPNGPFRSTDTLTEANVPTLHRFSNTPVNPVIGKNAQDSARMVRQIRRQTLPRRAKLARFCMAASFSSPFCQIAFLRQLTSGKLNAAAQASPS